MGQIVRRWDSASEYLTALSEESEVLAERATERFAGLSPAQLGWRPAPKSWSVAECLDHLLTTHGLYLESIDRTLGRSVASSDPDAGFESGPLANRFIRSLGPDSTLRMKAPGLFKPAPLGPGEPAEPGIVHRFVEQQRTIVSVIERCRALDLTKAKVSSPASGLLRFRLGDALRLLVEHGKRHLKQAEGVMASAGFPSD